MNWSYKRINQVWIATPSARKRFAKKGKTMLKQIPVSQLNSYLKGILDSEELLFNIRIFGEITDFSLNKGNACFTLKDDEASLSCCWFGVEQYGGNAVLDILKNGEKVVLTGSPKFYVKGGRVNFQVSRAEKIGLGEAMQRFLELKEKLKNLGWFDNKKAIPKQINHIGVITSKDGSVLQDIINIVGRRNPLTSITVYHATVQGTSKEVIEGIKSLDGKCDVLVVARGGGSEQDLSCFNDEELAKTIHNAKTPIISAVGHETDFTICDFVADLRAPTPSAAAEICTIDIVSELENLKNRLIRSLNTEIQKQKSAENNLKYLRERLEKFNPTAMMKLGYSILNKKYENIEINDIIEIAMLGGKITAEVKGKNNV